jgi:UDP-N-acetyl-D-galactosamine dehydrogenase
MRINMTMELVDSRLNDNQLPVSVTGLGYVGLPVALALAKKRKVIGFDINAERVAMMQKDIDPSGELEKADFEGADITFTSNPDELKKAWFHIIAVPTPIDKHTMPDLKPLLSASETIGKQLKKDDYVVFESTVYPGCTEDDCVPLLERYSGLRFNIDFRVGYSPERINPGDKQHTLSNVVKVVSGSDAKALATVAALYRQIVDAGVFEASSIKVAEAAKIIENTQRDLNIALMNELSIICDKLKINTYEVLEAAGTKWNFLPFSPGLVGGHCIGVDPYYLTYKSKALGHDPQVILSGRYINDYMATHVAKKTVQRLIQMGRNPANSRVLLMGITFKENVSDIRNSKVANVYQELVDYGLHVDVIDPYANEQELYNEYAIKLSAAPTGRYDAAIVAVPHKQYLNWQESDFEAIGNGQMLLVDIKGLYRKTVKRLHYWSL